MAKAYHRDDLRRELLNAAEAHILAHGHAELSVRRLAQMVDVSPGAPYHHFSDRRAVLVAVAERGFQTLVADIGRAASSVSGAADRLVATGHAFIEFAVSRSKLFDLMYDSELTRPVLDPVLEAEYHRAYLLVLAEFQRLTSTPEDARARVFSYWSTIFGCAFLTGRAMLSRFIANPLDERSMRDQIIRTAIGDPRS